MLYFIVLNNRKHINSLTCEGEFVDVSSRIQQPSSVVAEKAKPAIAVVTEKATNDACCMAVIDAHISDLLTKLVAANRATTVLRFKHSLLLFRLKSIFEPVKTFSLITLVFWVAFV